MKSIRKYILALLFIFLSVEANCAILIAPRAIDDNLEKAIQDKTDILRDVLKQLMKEKIQGSSFGYSNVTVSKASRGVYFNLEIPNSYHFNAVTIHNRLERVYDQLNKKEIEKAIVKGTGHKNVNIDFSSEKEFDVEVDNLEKGKEIFEESITEIAYIFFKQYAQLLTELDDEQVIYIKNQPSKNNTIRYFSTANEKVEIARENLVDNNFQASVKMKDVRNYVAGKIKEDRFESLINLDFDPEVKEIPIDVKLIGNLLRNIYEIGQSDTYFSGTEMHTRIEYFEGSGYEISLPMYSAYVDGSIYSMPTIKSEKLSEDERNKAVQDLFPKWEKSFVKNLATYALTVSSLKEGENLTVNVMLPACTSCDDFPKNKAYTVPFKIIEDMRKGKISVNEAVNKINQNVY